MGVFHVTLPSLFSYPSIFSHRGIKPLSTSLGKQVVVGVTVVVCTTHVPVEINPSKEDHHRINVVNATELLPSDANAQWLSGSDVALVIGGSTIPVPAQQYVSDLTNTFLKPLGFEGKSVAIFTPEGLYPVSGTQSLMLNSSMREGQEILMRRIMAMYQDHQFSAEHPLTVFSWSQSTIMCSDIMPLLRAHGIPSEDLRFVMIGDVVAPNGGLLERYNIPIDGHPIQFPGLGIDFQPPTPDDDYPTYVYTDEYDLFADFPRYSLDLISDLNALMGILAHVNYLNETSSEIDHAIPLETTGEGMVHYFEIPSTTIPLLAPLQLLPIVGQPLYDLFAPDTRILIDLGYGNITQGWDSGPANEWEPVSALPDVNPLTVLDALFHGGIQGIREFVSQLTSPADWNVFSVLNAPIVTEAVGVLHSLGYTGAKTLQQFISDPEQLLRDIGDAAVASNNFPIDNIAWFDATPDQIIDDLTATVEADYSLLLPTFDTLVTILWNLPELTIGDGLHEFFDGHPLNAIFDPLAIETALIPFAEMYGIIAPDLENLNGTMINLADLAGVGVITSDGINALGEL